MKLTERFIDETEFQGQIIKLNLAFDNVLRVSELLSDETFDEIEKLDILFEMLVKNAYELELSIFEISQLIGFLLTKSYFLRNLKTVEKAILILNKMLPLFMLRSSKITRLTFLKCKANCIGRSFWHY
ncbi:Gp15 family bacteriophage protein [Cytobacillus pseudoceanisediminis]|uniref:Gp15 family bacteriophage protein n=1 Tax=Cytobacillus pseudoceanisediminis TaxID=3051614 RepID=UPI002540AF4B|nr:Gp15 family bacteriophage protein [Cytobacillus pseudoceanisediminis]